MTKTKPTIWISHDLGVRGDYEGLYAWLDAHGAKECVNSLAVLKFEYTNSLIEELEKELKESVIVDKRTRIYVIYRDRTTGRNKGTFLFGGRKAASWAGYASDTDGTTDEE
jgi:hypothetical protein